MALTPAPIIYKYSSKKILNVPYWAQPNNYTCSATCLKMMAHYIFHPGSPERKRVNKTNINSIYKTLIYHRDIPVKRYRKKKEVDGETVRYWAPIDFAHMVNMAWWLNREITSKENTNKYAMRAEYKYFSEREIEKAIDLIRINIRSGYPMIMSTSNDQTDGHYILLTGYSYRSNEYPPSPADYQFICNDPYGRYHQFRTSKAKIKGKYIRLAIGSFYYAKGRIDIRGSGEVVEYDSKGIYLARGNLYQMITLKKHLGSIANIVLEKIH